MAKSTIHTLAAKAILDTGELQDGTTLSRREIGLLKKAMSDVETPLEKYERKMEELGTVLKKDARLQELYNRQAAKLKTELDAATIAADDFNDEMDDGRGVMGGWVNDLTDVNSLVNLASSAFGLFQGAMEKFSKLDADLLDLKRFGISSDDFGTLKVLASQAGAEITDLADLIKDVQVRTGEAAKGDGIASVFEELSLNVEELIKLKPVDQLEAIGEAIQKVDDRTKQTQIADELFGDAGTKFLDNILLVPDAIDKAAEKAERLGLALSSQDAAKIREAAAGWRDVGLRWEGFTNQLMIDFLPVLENIIKFLEDKTDLDVMSGGEAEFTMRTGSGSTQAVQVFQKRASQQIAAPESALVKRLQEIEARRAKELKEQTNILKGIKKNQETSRATPTNIGS